MLCIILNSIENRVSVSNNFLGGWDFSGAVYYDNLRTSCIKMLSDVNSRGSRLEEAIIACENVSCIL